MHPVAHPVARWFSSFAGLVLFVATTGLGAQGGVPVAGAPIATQGTVEQEYKAANTIIVKTIDGVEHAFRFTKNLLIHGGKNSVDGLKDLHQGTTVVVHYTVNGTDESAEEIDRIGDDGLMMTEGVVTNVDRGRKQMSVRFDNGTTETFRLTDRAAVDAGQDVDPAAAGGTRVVVYYDDENGDRVAHFFVKAP